MNGKKAKIRIYKSAEISACKGALKKSEKNASKKFQSEALMWFCKNKIVLLTFHGVILKSGNVKKINFLFRL